MQLASWPQNGIALLLAAQVARPLNSKLKRDAVFLLGEINISTGYELTGHARSNGSLFRVALSPFAPRLIDAASDVPERRVGGG